MNTNINNNPLHPQTNFVQQNTRSTKSRKNWKKRELERQKKRAREREEMQRQFNNLTKPFHKQKLPKDASFLIFSLLDPLMKANCHLVCKSWRFSILLDPLLCNALDLSKLGKETPIKSFFEHFNRLSFYAGDRLVKVSLDLSSFWLDYLSNQQVYETSVCSDLFQTILFKSRATLREISLRFVLEGADFCKFNLSFFPFLNSTLQQLQSYPLLKSIYIEGPSSVSFTLRSDQVRVFEIQDNFEELAEGADNLSDESDDEYEQPEVSHFAPIVECGKRFLGEQAYFSQFETDRYLEDPDQNSSSLVDLLSDSTSTLEILQLDSITVRGSDLWSLVIQCDKLKALRIALPLLIDHAEERAFVELKSPEVSLINSNLQSLSLESYGGFSVEWDLTSPWLGSNVTDLYLLDHPDRYGNYNLMKGPSDLNSLFRNITKTITHIRLRELHPRVGTGGVTNVKMLETLPNLRSLSLDHLHWSFLEFFNTSVIYPNLQELEISSNGSGQSPVSCFLALLKANSSNLVKIRFSHGGETAPELPSTNLNLNFNRLSELRVDDHIGLWFATLSNEFPRLSLSHLSPSIHEAFSLKAPQLLAHKPPKPLKEHSSDDSSSDSSEDQDDDE